MTTTNQDDAPPKTTSVGTSYHIRRKETSFWEVLVVLWERRIPIIAVTIVFTAVAATLCAVSDDKFQATVTLSPVSDDSSGGRLGGLATLASQLTGGGAFGLSMPGNTQKQESIATLQSEALTERYIKENNLLPILYDGKWDSVKHAWKDLPPNEIPTLWKANQYFRKSVRSVLTDGKTGLTTLTISWKNPQEAATWANGMVKMANDYLRGRAIEDSERNIAYLKDQLAKTSIIGIQTAINSLLENEMKKEMLAQGSSEYALKVIDPAFAPEKRSSPIPTLWISMGFLLGSCSSILVVFVRRFRPIGLYLRDDSADG